MISPLLCLVVPLEAHQSRVKRQQEKRKRILYIARLACTGQAGFKKRNVNGRKSQDQLSKPTALCEGVDESCQICVRVFQIFKRQTPEPDA